MKLRDKYRDFVEYFIKNNPSAETELIYSNPFQLLVSVILSAQCTDKRVNIVTPSLFKTYPNADKFSKATFDDIFPYIKSISYPNSKTRYLIEMSKQLVEKFNSIIPSDINQLRSLKGVGRKTANVIASVVYKQNKMPVDTHVHRVSQRIGLVRNGKSVIETEKQLVKYLPENKIGLAHHWLILHGRYICVARNPKCLECGIKNLCQYYTKKNPCSENRDL